MTGKGKRKGKVKVGPAGNSKAGESEPGESGPGEAGKGVGRNDVLFTGGWVLTLLSIVAFLVWDIFFGYKLFTRATTAHPFIMGFVKVSILASMGELLAIRLATGAWKKPPGMIWRFLVWGLIGMSFVIVFALFAGGVKFIIVTKGFLWVPGDPAAKTLSMDTRIAMAFWTSLITNLIFAPTFMALHRITDTAIELGGGRIGRIVKVPLADIVRKIDWTNFISFVVRLTIPIFWVPAHTFTFSLDPEYQVLSAAFLSLVLGAILAFAKRMKQKTPG